MKAKNKTTAISTAVLFICAAAVLLLTKPVEKMLPAELPQATSVPELNYVTSPSRNRKSQEDLSVSQEDQTVLPRAMRKEQKLSLAYRVHTEPAAVYNKYIGDAEIGDAKAQFIVAHALRSCPSRQLTEEEAQRLKYDHSLPQVIKDDLAELWSRCNALYVQLPNTDMRVAYHSWLETASANGNAIAQTQRDLMFHMGAFDREHYARLLPKALEQAGKDQYLRSQVYDSVVMYLSQYGNWQEEQRAAWNLLSCRSEPGCDESSLLLEYSSDYHPQELEFIQRKADDYLKALEAEDYGALELDLIVEPE